MIAKKVSLYQSQGTEINLIASYFIINIFWLHPCLGTWRKKKNAERNCLRAIFSIDTGDRFFVAYYFATQLFLSVPSHRILVGSLHSLRVTVCFSEAINALNTLKPADITLVKSMKNPPDTVKTVMAAVCVMKDVPPDRIPNPNKPGQMVTFFSNLVVF